MSLTLAISRPRYNFVKFFLHIPPSYLKNRLIEGFVKFFLHIPPSYLENRLIEGFSPLYLTVSMYKLWAQKASELALKSRHGGKLAIYLTCPLRQEVRANNFLEKISENEKMIPPTP